MSTKRASEPRKPSDPLEDALRALVAGLKAAARPSMIIGGIAVIACGVPRLTRDIDATVVGAGTDLQELVAVLRRHQIVSARAVVKKGTRKKPSSGVAAQQGAAPDSASSHATRGRTRRR